MNKFSKMMGVTALSMSLTVPALAEVSAPVNNNQQVHNELAYAFGDNTDLQAKAISNQEMNDTQGAWVANAIGGLAGMYGAGYGYVAGGGNNPYKFVGAAALGGALGFASPVTGIRSGATALATGFASTYIPTRFGGKYW